tara:strand:- start:1463 stop:1963 length:501 start_codon:yes stop_codon:yes gene_type:complete
MNDFNIIVACDNNNGIGKNNKLPWHNKDDITYFSNITKGDKNNSIIMGRKTWESIQKKPLIDRDNLILSKTLNMNKCFKNIEELIIFINDKKYSVNWIIGGETIYKQFLENKNIKIKYIYLTKINKKFDCDAYFPKIPEYFYIKETIRLNNYTEIIIYHNKDYSLF